MMKEMAEVIEEREKLYEQIRKLTGMRKDRMDKWKGLVQRSSWVSGKQLKHLLESIVDMILVGVPLDEIEKKLEARAE